MANPQTVNVGIIVPLTGADPGTWGSADVNPNMVSIDGFIAGVQTIAVSNAPVTLTKPAGFTPTPGAGPTQSQNRVLRFTGVLSANVEITLPLPGFYAIDNQTTGAFVLSFRGVTATEVIGAPPGEITEIYNDGVNVRFVNLARRAAMEMWAGLTAMPAWVTACTVDPYLLCDGAVYNFSDYPGLANRLGGSFGGNGVTTFGVPDMRGRVPLAYDGTGTRITAAGCGINGQTLGAALDAQTVTLTIAQIPTHFHAAVISDPTHVHPYTSTSNVGNTGGGGAFGNSPIGNVTSPAATGVRVTSVNGNDTTGSSGGGGQHANVQPSQVTGIWAIKT